MLNPKKQLDQWGPLESVVLYTSFWFLPVARLIGEQYHTPWPNLICLYDHDFITFYWERDDMTRKGLNAIKERMLPKNKQNQLWKKYLAIVASLKKESRLIRGLPDDCSQLELAERARAWYGAVMNFWSIASVAELANFVAPPYMRARLAKHVPRREIDSALETLLALTRLSFHQQNELELLKLVSKKNQTKKDWDNFRVKWHWAENSYYQNKALTKKDFLAYVSLLSKKQRLQKIENIKNYPAKTQARKKAIIKKYNLPQSIVRASEALSYSIWWQDHRKAVAWWLDTLTDILSKKAARMFNVPFNDLLHYTAEDWQALLVFGKRVSQSVVRERKKYVLFDLLKKGSVEYPGNRARAVIRSINKAQPAGDKAGIVGITVSTGAGVARGFVRILRSSRQAGKMKPGEILVAPMTTPDYILAMRKAVAIITDVGGLMSHAAVISRELEIPCIVGTKIATQVLKDGDKVEVDAIKGIVRKL